MNDENAQADLQADDGLQPAEENVYYCLATLHGEIGEQALDTASQTLIRKNRNDWNLWATSAMGTSIREKLLSDGYGGFAARPFRDSERTRLAAALAMRMGVDDVDLPDPRRTISLTNIRLAHPALLSRRVFPTDIDFSGSHFLSRSSFVGSRFMGEASFVQSSFVEPAVFSGTTFDETASFDDCRFEKGLSLGNANVAFGLYLERAACSGNFALDGATIGGTAHLRKLQVARSSSFARTVFTRDADFEETIFSEQAIFLDAKFGGRTSFGQATFRSYAPDFRGAVLHEATEFHQISWPPAPDTAEKAQQQLYAYERLKLEMERLKKHEDEQFFFRKELRARRSLAQTGRLERMLNWLYEKTSDYGQSLAKPALAFAWLWAAGGAAIKEMGFQPTTAMLFSAANMLPFLPVKRDMTQTLVAGSTELPGVFHGVSLVQSTAGLVLLFLLGLTLRNRFRMR